MTYYFVGFGDTGTACGFYAASRAVFIDEPHCDDGNLKILRFTSYDWLDWLAQLKAWAVNLDDVIPLVSCGVFSDMAHGHSHPLHHHLL